MIGLRWEGRLWRGRPQSASRIEPSEIGQLVANLQWPVLEMAIACHIKSESMAGRSLPLVLNSYTSFVSTVSLRRGDVRCRLALTISGQDRDAGRDNRPAMSP